MWREITREREHAFVLPLILLHHTHSLENVTKIYSKIVTIILLCPDTDVLSDGECFVEHVSCGGDETFVGCPGCVTREGAQGLCQLACTGQGFSFNRGGASSDTSHWWIGWEEDDILNFMKINVDQMSGPFTRWFMVSFTLDNWEQYRRFVGGFLVFVERFIILLPS